MKATAQLTRGISRQLSGGSVRKSGRFTFQRNLSFDPRLSNVNRFNFGRQSSLDPNRDRGTPAVEELTVPDNLDSTIQLLFLACQGDAKGVEELLREGVDVNSIDLDGRTALHIAACEGNVNVVKLLLSWRANIDARDRWGSTVKISYPSAFGVRISYYALIPLHIFHLKRCYMVGCCRCQILWQR